jgi:DNA-binding transcriptional MerR regulator
VRAGEVARRAGVNAATLRYYERRGLLPAPVRTPSGHRHYDEDAVRFLRAIKEAQAIGFTLAEIEEYLRVARSEPGPALRTRAAAKIDEIDARIARLRRMRDELARIVGCACESLDHCTCGAAYLARRGREAPVRPSPLHVTNGDSAGNTLRQTTLGGAVLPWQDVLHEGPLPAGPRRELLQARSAFLSACGWGSRPSILASLEDRDRQLVRALKDGHQVVLWFEHDLYDQLQLVDALALAAGAGRAPELIVVGSFPGRPGFRGLGELTADELETLWLARVPASQDTLAAAVSVWAALRHPGPSALAEAAAADLPGLPFLRPALLRLLEELPAPGDGLSGTERRALRAVAAGAATPVAAFLAVQDLEAASFLGDAWFFRALTSLGTGPNRLIETQDGDPLPPPPPLGDARAFARLPLRLTGPGERVLDGRQDRVALLGLDRWLGGTHLTPAAAWRWDPAARLLIGPSARLRHEREHIGRRSRNSADVQRRRQRVRVGRDDPDVGQPDGQVRRIGGQLVPDRGGGPGESAVRGAGVVPHHQVQVVVDVGRPRVVAVQHPRRVHLAAQVVERAACAGERLGRPSHQHESRALHGEGPFGQVLAAAGERDLLPRPEPADPDPQRRREAPGQDVHHQGQVHLPPLARVLEQVLVDDPAVLAHAVERDQRGVHLLQRVRAEAAPRLPGDQRLHPGQELMQAARFRPVEGHGRDEAASHRTMVRR